MRADPGTPATLHRTLLAALLAGPLVAGLLAATAAAAAAQENVEFFDLPAGAGPHDVSPAPDGKVWYTAQRQGALGILDPATGEVEQVPLGEGSAPHGVITGPDGKAWITDGGQNAIVSFDTDTREVAVHPLPEDTGYSNLNTAALSFQRLTTIAKRKPEAEYISR
jgi:virginiamycin B lyase